jgi:hypothetical protein
MVCGCRRGAAAQSGRGRCDRIVTLKDIQLKKLGFA